MSVLNSMWFKENEISYEFLEEFMYKAKIYKAISDFSMDMSIIPKRPCELLSHVRDFMKISNLCLEMYGNPDLITSFYNFFSDEMYNDPAHSYIHCFGDDMWHSASNMKGNPMDYYKIDVSDSIDELKNIFDLFSIDIIPDVVSQYVYSDCSLDDDIDLDDIVDSIYINIAHGYRDAGIVDSSPKPICDESISRLSSILTGELHRMFKVELVYIEYDGIDDFILENKDNQDSINYMLDVLVSLIRHSCPQYINITKPQILSSKNPICSNHEVSSQNVIVFAAFSDFYEDYYSMNRERSDVCKAKEFYKIWDSFNAMDILLNR